jgi:aminopeptidase-like protein
MNLLAYADGTLDLVGIGDAIGVSIHELAAAARTLVAAGLLAADGPAA